MTTKVNCTRKTKLMVCAAILFTVPMTKILCNYTQDILTVGQLLKTQSTFPLERHNQLMAWLSFHDGKSDSLTAGLLTGKTLSHANNFTQTLKQWTEVFF